MGARMPPMDDLRYPTGTFSPVPSPDSETWQRCRAAIRSAPADLRRAVAGLSETQLDTPYRPGGWTVRQVVHHVPDSHMNAYVRTKLALTEERPTIKAYDQSAWARLRDTAVVPVEVSLSLLEGVHQRWMALLDGLEAADYARPLVHPEHGEVTLGWLVQMYAWHGAHHVAHVTGLRAREGWG
jgi:DinB superfamily